MPNHVTNILSFSGDEKEIKKLLKTIKGENFEDGTPRLIDFSKIIPFPEELKGTISPTQIVTQEEYDEWMRKYNAGELNGYEKDNKPLTKEMSNEYKKKYGADNWYDWRCANWGTKWGAYEISKGEGNSIVFQTAWSTPIPVIEKLSEMFPEVAITLEYADEDFGHNCGIIEFEGGGYEETESESYELANRILCQVDSENALETFMWQDEDHLDGDYTQFVLKIMFEDFCQPTNEALQELSEAHLEAMLNYVKGLEREDLKEYEALLHEILDNKISFFTLPNEIKTN